MRRLCVTMLIGSAIVLSGCATDRAAKPLLTAGASRAIAKACGAVRSEFHRDTPNLPYAVFILKADEVYPEGGPSPTMRCIGERLEGFRHAMFPFHREGRAD